MKCFFDIETEANEEALEFLPEPSAPSNWKDPEKIAAYVAEKRIEQAEKAALDMDFGKITAAAVRIGSIVPTGFSFEGPTVGFLVNEKRTEKDLLKTLWTCFHQCGGEVVGYNILGFDIPYIIRRSFALNITPPIMLDQGRYRSNPTTDLMQILAGWDTQKIKSLKFIAARYGIPNPLPDLEGSQYAGMPPETRLAYVKNDVNMVVQLYWRMKFFYPL